MPQGKHVLSGFEGTGFHGVRVPGLEGRWPEGRKRACSSVGQSTRLISVGSVVQIYPGPPGVQDTLGN